MVLKDLYHAGRALLRRTGRDVFRLDTLESLQREVETVKRQYELLQREAATDAGKSQVVAALKSSLEHQKRFLDAYRIEKNIVPFRADKYVYELNVNNDELLMFKATTPEDFDWLEHAIFKYGYYEKPGVWSFSIDEDKRTLADMVATFGPRRTLDFGCANGPLVQALADLGVKAEGVDISPFALEQAFPGIKANIHLGDIVQLPLQSSAYDVITGMDIFEHLNPNKFDACVAKLRELLVPGGSIFTNIPAFGRDEVFGEVFPYYMADWDQQRDGSTYFKTLHADGHGYPVNGHLIWADTKWWVNAFAKHGFVRRIEKERELHAQFDGRLYHSRISFYVFEKR